MWWEVPGHLEIKKSRLYIAGVAATDLAKRFGTPIYVYNSKRVVELFRRFYRTVKKNTDKEVRIYYAAKANSNIEILKLLNKEGAWLDAVSPEEVNRAIEAGFPKDRILFTGTSVSNSDLKTLVKTKVMINIDSPSEMSRLGSVAKNYSVSIRMDPGVKGLGHHWKVITAGKDAHGLPIKFAIPGTEVLSAVRLAKKLSLDVVGLHEHVGSNWRTHEELDEFLKTVDALLKKANQMTKLLGHGLEFVSFGGGPGVRYMESHPEFPLDIYAKEICERVEESGLKCEAIGFEPGRYLVADSGLLLVEVTDIKERYGNTIVGVNSGFNHLIRPTLYGSYHEIINCTRADANPNTVVTVAGNLCETGDVFTPKPRKIPRPREGDVLALHNSGAYGYVMSSNYNLRALPKEIVL